MPGQAFSGRAIEQVKYSPNLERAFRIAQVFGVGVEAVFSWHG
ncbi:hypothetical protein [Sandarakinorhabdus sp.]|nr:hypothetical protein [Sandarakinorhabdus sp.]